MVYIILTSEKTTRHNIIIEEKYTNFLTKVVYIQRKNKKKRYNNFFLNSPLWILTKVVYIQEKKTKKTRHNIIIEEKHTNFFNKSSIYSKKKQRKIRYTNFFFLIHYYATANFITGIIHLFCTFFCIS